MQIYRILNIITGKSYIGKSANYLKRWITHKNNAKLKINRRLYDSINFHGEEKFSISLIEELTNCRRDEIDDRERYWIKKFNTLIPNGYNMTIGGEGGNTLVGWSNEEKRKLWNLQAQNRNGYKHSEYTKQLISAGHIGKKLSNSHKRDISETLKKKHKVGILVSQPPILFGSDNPNWVDVDILEVLEKIKSGHTLKSIAECYSTSTVTIGTKLKNTVGKTFTELRNYYGITGRFSKPKLNTA